MNRTHLLLSTGLVAACLLSTQARAALVDLELPPVPGLLASAEAEPAAAWLASPPALDPRAFALSFAPAAGPQAMTSELRATATAVGSSALPSAATLSLWTFITAIRAQQQGDRFVALETNVSLLRLAEGPAAPVPLPAALWLMVVGLLGMVGVRYSGAGKAGSATKAWPAHAAHPRLAATAA
ncbi:hypothetical protein D621_11060 [beta proteobacterium AAP51]|nr:hypothetical protein D621_11060 [beta proteobacterium AAP51]